MGSKGKKQLAHGRDSVTKGFSRGYKFSHWASFLASQKQQTFCIWFTLKMLNCYPDEELLVAMRGQAILGGATISLVCDGRGLWRSQIGSLHRSGGGTALVDAMFHRARVLGCRFLATSPLDDSAHKKCCHSISVHGLRLQSRQRQPPTGSSWWGASWPRQAWLTASCHLTTPMARGEGEPADFKRVGELHPTGMQ